MANGEILHPFVLWGQTKEYLYLSIKLTNVTSPTISIEDDDITFRSQGVGVQGAQKYGFSIVPYHSIISKGSYYKLDTLVDKRGCGLVVGGFAHRLMRGKYIETGLQESRYEVRDKSVEITLRKEYVDPWPRLTRSTQKLAWVRFDFDRFQFDTSDEDEDEKDQKVATEAIEKMTSQLDETEAFMKLIKNPLTVYLLGYNIFQFAGYFFLFGSCIWNVFNDGEKAKRELYDKVSDQLIVVQLASCLDLLHAAMGWVKSGFIPAFMQVFARNLVLFFMIVPNEDIQHSDSFFWLVVIWSSIEIIRYPYYLLALIGEENGLLTYLRYTLWIPLYPSGMMTEGRIILMALPEIEAKKKFSLELPNSWNWSFNFTLFIKIYFFVILFGLYHQMMHMYKRRKAKIGPNPKSGLNKMSLLPFLTGSKKKPATSQPSKGKSLKIL